VSLTTVTDTVQGFLAQVPGITTVFQEMPWSLVGDAWMTNAQGGTVAIVHVVDMTESRAAMGGVINGRKAVDYTVQFLMLYYYEIPSDLGGASYDVWSVGQKALVDAVVGKIRSDPAFGCGENGPIFEAGNQDNGITTRFDMPVNLGPGTVVCWTSTEFKVTEIVIA
jgi:hypothetical protein